MRWLVITAFLLSGFSLPVRAAPCVGIPGDEAVTVQLFFGRTMKGGECR